MIENARSHSGPIGVPLDKALGLDGDDALDELWPETQQAIEAQGLTKVVRIDRGGYGAVYRATDRTTNNDRAVKIFLRPDDRARYADGDLKYDRPEDEERLRYFQREARILDAPELPQRLAPKLYNSFHGDGIQPFLVMEWINGSSLADFLENHPGLPRDRREMLCRNIWSAYARLHGANLLHRDPSLKNIMVEAVGKDYRVRLIDFSGSARAAPGYKSLNSFSKVPTTLKFASAAVARLERKPTIADEVHAVAKICFTVLTGKLAADVPQCDWEKLLKEARVPRDTSRLLLPKMNEPPSHVIAASTVGETPHEPEA